MAGSTSRRAFLGTVGMTAGALAAGGPGALPAGAAPGAPTPRPRTPDGALRALRAGNVRYRRGEWTRHDYSPVAEQRASAQAPFAAVLTCADSRISPPLVFDVERGNLFCAHVAGNSVETATLGSIEYAVLALGVKLVMVLGHTDCGAVKAALTVASGAKTYPPERYGSIGAIVDEIVPAVRDVPAGPGQLRAAIAANARAQAAELSAADPIIAPAIAAGRLKVVAAVYDIATGRVHAA